MTSGVLQISGNCLNKNSRCHQNCYIWSTPDVYIYNDIWSTWIWNERNIWSTPGVIRRNTSGVLHKSSRMIHLEYSRCHLEIYIWSTSNLKERAIWSTPDVFRRETFGALQMSLWDIHLEYSICHLERIIWSTPDFTRNDTFGVLQMSPKGTSGVLRM